jgi:hypothetical protein
VDYLIAYLITISELRNQQKNIGDRTLNIIPKKPSNFRKVFLLIKSDNVSL